jgi:phage gp29-like protein
MDDSSSSPLSQDAANPPVEPKKLAAKAQRFTPDQQAVEDLVDSALVNANSPISVAKLRQAILTSESHNELVLKLGELFGGEDQAAFEELMGKALFAADVLGYTMASTKTGGG